MTIELAQQATVHAAIVIAAVAAIRKQVPKVDGPWVLALAALCASLACALLLPMASVADALHACRVAALAWLIAVGGNEWITKITGRKN